MMLMSRAIRRKRQTTALPTTRKPSNPSGLDTTSFQNTYQGVFGDYNSVTRNDAPPDIPINPAKDVLAAKSSSDSGVKQAFDLAGQSPASTNRDVMFSATVSNASYKSRATWYPTLSSLGTSQTETSPEQSSLTPPSMNLDDFANENPLSDFNNYGELSDDPLSSFLEDNPDKNNLQTDLGIGPSDLFPDALEIFPSYPYKTGPLYSWVRTWPVRELDDQTWSDIGSTRALSRPEWATVEHLLRLYFQYLNPLFPVLKERDIYYLIHPEAQSDGVQPKPISLALFNAIMFAASSVSSSISIAGTNNNSHITVCA
jgi:hypothetical protein